MSSKGIRLTVGEKILILLLEYTRFRGELEAPLDVTQDGLASKLGIIRSAVPRAVGSMIDKGLLEESLAHIHGLTRRRKVYMLTEGGIIKARTLLGEISLIEITVKDEKGSEIKLLGDLLSSGEVDMSIVSKLLSTKVLDKTRALEDEGQFKLTNYIHSLTPPEMFFGREREIEEIKEAIRSKTRKITAVYGIAGVGKTTLSWKVTQIFGEEMNIFYIDLKEWTSLSYLLKELGAFLEKAGWDHLKGYIETTRDLDIEAVCDLLKNIPPEIPHLLVFDDLHRAPPDVTSFLTSLKERLPVMKGTNLIVLSRERINFYDIRDIKLKNIVGELELLGFDRKTSRNFLIQRGFHEKEVDAIIERTGGHPLALVLVEKEGYSVETEDFDQFLEVEIFSKLAPEQTYIIGLLSLCRLQLGEEELIGVKEANAEVLGSLLDHHLIFDTPGGHVVHDLVRSHAIENMSPAEKARACGTLASIFHEKLTSLGFYQDIGREVPPIPFIPEDHTGLGPVPLYVSEEIYHLMGSNDLEEALRVMVRSLLLLPSKDLINELGDELLDRIPEDVKGETRLFRDLIEVSIRILKGENEEAMELIEGIAGSKWSSDLGKGAVAAAGLWRPWIHERVNGPEDALKVLMKIKKKGIPPSLGFYFRATRASLLYKLGDHKSASKEYSSFLDDLLNNEDLPMQLKESIKEALDHARSGEIQKATDGFQNLMNLIQSNMPILREEMAYVNVDHHLLSAIYSVYYGRNM